MALIMNYEDSLLPEGEYEMVIKSACENVTKGGTQHISIPMVVRNDVQQKFQICTYGIPFGGQKIQQSKTEHFKGICPAASSAL